MAEDLLRSKHTFPLLDQSGLLQVDGVIGGEQERKKLLLRKGVFCYDHVTSLEMMKSAAHLPSKESFFSVVTNSDINQEDYDHALEVFDSFRCQNLLQYAELYCELDTLLLAECFIQFRAEVEAFFDLDCCHYISLPMLSFDAMLKMTGVEIELVTDPEMCLMLENSIRGGLSNISQRYSRSTEDGGGTLGGRQRHMVFLDQNGLYSFGQSCPQPISDFTWADVEEYVEKDWSKYEEGAEYGMILEVDLIYPGQLHDSHDSFPLCPHRLDIDESMLSPYQLRCLRELRSTDKHRSRKLVSSFLPRTDYVVHEATLSTYLQLGMQLKAVKRILKFKQSSFLKIFIDFCIEKRRESQTEFRKRLFKVHTYITHVRCTYAYTIIF